MSDIDDRIVGVGVAFVTTLWSWVVFSATMALFSGDRATAAILGPNSTPAMYDRVGPQIPGYWGTFVRTLTLDGRQSWVIQQGAPGWELVGQSAGRTMKLVVVALVLALLIAVPLVVLSQVDVGRRAVAGFSLLGGIPTFIWCLFALDFAKHPGSHIMPRTYAEMLVPGATLAIPLGLGLTRIVSRYDVTDVRTMVRDVLLDGWLYVVWIPGALVVVETVFAVNGVFYLWFQALVQGDFPLFTLLSSVLVAPVLFCAFVRDVLLAVILPESTSSTPTRSVAADGGTTSVLPPLLSAVRHSRVTQAALGLFGLLSVVGLVGSQLTSRPDRWANKQTVQPYQLFDALAAVTLTAVIVFLVAAAVGVGLGLLATGTSLPRHLNRVLDPVANLPFAVFFVAWLIYLESPDRLVTQLLFGGVGGLAVAPIVARRFEREATEGRGETAVLAATGVAISGAALVVFTVTELSFLGYGLGDLWLNTTDVTLESRLWSWLGVLAVPAVTLFLLGEGLRRYEPTA
ncbi:hypothetical protein [Haloarchaeobius litoreus]|uniref:Uncharacterized protein n=1 Tax=Haloarchaeobius litoreus TaxID=755306 RepID=A0ABD6DFI2_9EURY|nr:hypothetical protein [Haloarchaeobius litoreus]